ncbi:hypothetical protein FKB34_01910 [Glycocaulis profundi]|nr:hypothetical protein FKB34_01910 [Glycocaulis profundi]
MAEHDICVPSGPSMGEQLDALESDPVLLTFARAALAEIDQEIEQRQTSGLDEYWQGLKAISDQGHAALRKAESAPMRWRPISELADRYHQPLLLASPVLIDGDKNPLGIADGFWQDDEGWVVADWCMCHDTFHRRVLAEHDVTHFCIPNGPWSGDDLAAFEMDAAARLSAEGGA